MLYQYVLHQYVLYQYVLHQYVLFQHVLYQYVLYQHVLYQHVLYQHVLYQYVLYQCVLYQDVLFTIDGGKSCVFNTRMKQGLWALLMGGQSEINPYQWAVILKLKYFFPQFKNVWSASWDT